jgi:hypothetical protein
MPDLDTLLYNGAEDSRFVKGGLVTWFAAAAIVDEWFKEWIDEADKKLANFSSYRAWKVKRGVMRIIIKFWMLAHLELAANLYPQNRPKRGVQRIVTSRPWNPTERRGGVEYGMFNGKPAWKRPVGRPPLPPSVYLERQHKRIQAKREKNKTKIKHKDRKPLPTVPPRTVMPRPSTGENFGSSLVAGKAREKYQSTNPKDWWRDAKRDVAEKILSTGIGEAAKNMTNRGVENFKRSVSGMVMDAVRQDLRLTVPRSRFSEMDR